MTDLEILMLDGCTKHDAEKHLNNGTIVFADFEENLDKYIDEWFPNANDPEDDDFDSAEAIINMVSTGKPAPDWGVVKTDDRTYYIMYVL